jgi:hypothetical protein
MSCDWHGCVRFKPAIAWPNYSGCDHNASQEIILKPKQSHVLDFGYVFSERKTSNPTYIRAGFRVITTSMLHQENSFSYENNDRLKIFLDDAKYSDKDFIWSNQIKIVF